MAKYKLVSATEKGRDRGGSEVKEVDNSKEATEDNKITKDGKGVGKCVPVWNVIANNNLINFRFMIQHIQLYCLLGTYILYSKFIAKCKNRCKYFFNYQGIDLVNDGPENALMREVDTIKASQDRMRKTLEQVNLL